MEDKINTCFDCRFMMAQKNSEGKVTRIVCGTPLTDIIEIPSADHSCTHISLKKVPSIIDF